MKKIILVGVLALAPMMVLADMNVEAEIIDLQKQQVFTDQAIIGMQSELDTQFMTNYYQNHAIALNKEELVKQSARINVLTDKVNGAYAQGAALSSLMAPYGVGNIAFTVGAGGYDGAAAVAAGLGYRVNETFATQVRVAYDNASEKASVGGGLMVEW